MERKKEKWARGKGRLEIIKLRVNDEKDVKGKWFSSEKRNLNRFYLHFFSIHVISRNYILYIIKLFRFKCVGENSAEKFVFVYLVIYLY